jgi:hypothetical protein
MSKVFLKYFFSSPLVKGARGMFTTTFFKFNNPRIYNIKYTINFFLKYFLIYL